ncbi:MAG: DUF488 family protein [Gemmatimonadaceae bacterium]
MKLYTVGHSTRTAEEFLDLLRRHAVERLVDVRAFPGSRRHPHFGRESLRAFLADAGMEYVHAPALGGRRKPRPDAPATAWRNAGFAAYADYMATPDFRRAVDDLLKGAAVRPTAIMCSEAVPWRCHRSMISDAVAGRGWEVAHILETSVSSHTLSPLAVLEGDEVRYPAPLEVQPALPLAGG